MRSQLVCATLVCIESSFRISANDVSSLVVLCAFRRIRCQNNPHKHHGNSDVIWEVMQINTASISALIASKCAEGLDDTPEICKAGNGSYSGLILGRFRGGEIHLGGVNSKDAA